MEKSILRQLVVISITGLFAACTKANIESSKEKVVALHDCTHQAIAPYICFDSLVTDSRCPAGAECIWQGTAIVEITFSETGNLHHFTMSLKGFPSLGYPNDTTINGYTIIFTDLKPYPDINHPQATETKAFFSISQ